MVIMISSLSRRGFNSKQKNVEWNATKGYMPWEFNLWNIFANILPFLRDLKAFDEEEIKQHIYRALVV